MLFGTKAVDHRRHVSGSIPQGSAFMYCTRRTWLRLVSASSLTWAGIGCSRQNRQSAPATSAPATSAPATSAPAKSVPAAAAAAGGLVDDPNQRVASRLIAADWNQVQQHIGTYAGRIVVLDLWSTYCPPCLKELPGLARLKKEFGDAIACLTLNCDFTGDDPLESLQPRIAKYLQQTGVESLDAHLISTVADQDLYTQLGIAAIPVVRVFDRSGKMVKQFDNERQEYAPNGFSYADHIGPLVGQLIRSSG
ncbi:MAG: TlpA disulfide reductase family protein [Pirellulales bacterium]